MVDLSIVMLVYQKVPDLEATPTCPFYLDPRTPRATQDELVTGTPFSGFFTGKKGPWVPPFFMFVSRIWWKTFATTNHDNHDMTDQQSEITK